MKSTLAIKDLSASKEIDHKAMSCVRGGQGDQGNVTGQSNALGIIAPFFVGNNSVFNGPTLIQADSSPTQTASNDSSSKNSKKAFLENW